MRISQQQWPIEYGCTCLLEEVKVGTCWFNDPLTDNDAGPFGGMKFSGGARELGEEGLEEFLETKHVHWDFSQERKAWWFRYGE